MIKVSEEWVVCGHGENNEPQYQFFDGYGFPILLHNRVPLLLNGKLLSPKEYKVDSHGTFLTCVYMIQSEDSLYVLHD